MIPNVLNSKKKGEGGEQSGENPGWGGRVQFLLNRLLCVLGWGSALEILTYGLFLAKSRTDLFFRSQSVAPLIPEREHGD